MNSIACRAHTDQCSDPGSNVANWCCRTCFVDTYPVLKKDGVGWTSCPYRPSSYTRNGKCDASEEGAWLCPLGTDCAECGTCDGLPADEL